MALPMRTSLNWLQIAAFILIVQAGSVFAIPETENQALLKLKDEWQVTFWDPTSPPCKWTGITCGGSDAYVIEIRLAFSGLKGQLSATLGAFTQLQLLDLSYNNDGLGGTIPPEIGSLKSLQRLDLQGNNLVGPLPSTITALTNLTHLSVMHNSLNGSIPTGIGNLKSLEWFEIAQNQFSGPLPDELGNMTAVQHFHFYNNSFTGLIPGTLSRLRSLIHLVLYNNNLSGALPPQLGDISSLTILELSNNRFTGQLPSSFANLQKLEQLVCRRCGLAGNLPDLKTPLGSLLYVDLSINNLTGSFPDFLSSSPKLKEINLENNKFAEMLPSTADRVVWFNGNPACNRPGAGQKECVSSLAVDPSVKQCKTTPPRCSSGMFNNPNLAACTCQQAVNATIILISPPFQSIPYSADEIEQAMAKVVDVDPRSVHVYMFQTLPKIKIMIQVFPPPGYDKFSPESVASITQNVTNISVTKLPPLQLGTIYADPSDLEVSKVETAASSSLPVGAIVGIVFGCIVAVALIIVLTFLACYQKRRADDAVKSQTVKSTGSGYGDPSPVGGPFVKQPKRFPFQDLATATNNFAADRAIGKGGYGNVYKGVLANGQAVAVKRSARGSTQGAAEFNMEVELLSRVHHKNLVDLVGYCIDDGEELLVYEYMENGTIRDKIITKVETPLSFVQRIEIALGSARGLQYLHEGSNPPIIHRDIKSSNILLDQKMVAKVADFGLCKVAEEFSAHSTNVKGTQGYLDPEYYRTQQITTKSDVYSFGVVLLELMTGKQPLEPQTNKFIVTEVKKSLKSEGGVHKFADGKMGQYPHALLERVVALALHCVAEDGENRPSMRDVVGLLEEIEGAIKNGTGAVGKRMSPSLETIDDDFASVTNSHIISVRSPYRSSTTSSDAHTSASSDFYCSGIVATDLRVEPK
eukprot:TRINITY_DN3502_c0_g2_i1.p1 TRINITY_DN3502_c0_g2~~TRINITY_DN3502_c0_g2_i1.p1  ORF type:complete len:921 (+),score=183.32 TRINITY_DN3502_c0_g2_i1:253-3015(+)